MRAASIKHLFFDPSNGIVLFCNSKYLERQAEKLLKKPKKKKTLKIFQIQKKKKKIETKRLDIN